MSRRNIKRVSLFDYFIISLIIILITALLTSCGKTEWFDKKTEKKLDELLVVCEEYIDGKIDSSEASLLCESISKELDEYMLLQYNAEDFLDYDDVKQKQYMNLNHVREDARIMSLYLDEVTKPLIYNLNEAIDKFLKEYENLKVLKETGDYPIDEDLFNE